MSTQQLTTSTKNTLCFGRRFQDSVGDEMILSFSNSDAIRRDLRRLNETVEGDLIVFVANDFGRPRAYRPQGVDKRVQNDVREALL